MNPEQERQRQLERDQRDREHAAAYASHAQEDALNEYMNIEGFGYNYGTMAGAVPTYNWEQQIPEATEIGRRENHAREIEMRRERERTERLERERV